MHARISHWTTRDGTPSRPRHLQVIVPLSLIVLRCLQYLPLVGLVQVLAVFNRRVVESAAQPVPQGHRLPAERGRRKRALQQRVGPLWRLRPDAGGG